MRDRPILVHIIHNDGPGGGPGALLAQVVFLREHFDTLVIHGGNGRIARECEAMGIPHLQLPLDRLYKLPAGLVRLAAALRRIRPRLVVLHGQWAGPVGALAARLARVPRLVYLAQWPSFYTDWDWWRVNRNFWAEWIPCRLADRVITLSAGNHYQYRIRGWTPEKKLVRLSNSVDTSAVPTPEETAAVRAAHGWRDDECHVVSVGRLDDQKRIDWLLRSWSLVQPAAPRARLWIVGDGAERGHLEKLAAGLSLNTCRFLGAMPAGLPFIAAADVVAMTTLYEAHANVPLEAMACGKPIVASGVDGVTDSVRDGVTGFLIPPGDTDAFAGRLLDLIRAPDLRRQVGRNARNAAQAFDTKTVLPRYLRLYEELLQE